MYAVLRFKTDSFIHQVMRSPIASDKIIHTTNLYGLVPYRTDFLTFKIFKHDKLIYLLSFDEGSTILLLPPLNLLEREISN